ncbi:putative membrane protein [Sphingomonas sp. SORGH_AS802]|uniref:DUF4142 domain-containing protein n=1 Tax=unclassified Sphingomonas TaxID=196159 RepID=UPI00285FBD4B|nr:MULTISPECIES: DUF4142 domain-containing protein [unclassified Sphingomonas]MDR6128174.1 putative membrane protein [Sphingomonas sp. SORGH_AS_0438]MDR6135622.1 putative membrane protein [Sphingomonas sp. SORGH_AS_0802]
MIRSITLAAIVALTPAAVSAQAVSPTTFVTKAGAGDLYEKTSSQLVLATSKNAKLRQFAQMMVRDHTKSTADVKAAAAKAGVTVPAPKLDAMGARDVAALRTAKGTARDSLYVTQQKAAHQRALTLHQGYAANGTSAPLKMVAGQIAPVVQTHLTELQAM